MSSFKKFSEHKLLDKCEFFSSLKDCVINEKEYERTLNVWKVFKIKDLDQYHDFLYLKTYVLLLCDMFEKCIDVCLKCYGLDPCHYFSTPGISWDAMLKMTRIKLELISDVDMHLFIEKGMRGGISYISKRHIKVDGDNKLIMYWDANNFYCWAMNQLLPYYDFNFLTKKEISEFCLNSIGENSPIGYILEVDLEYCKKLHDSHSDYPLAPEKIEISSDMLSKYCGDIANKYGIKVGGVNKLVPNSRDKIKYVVHYKNLQYYLSLGIKLIKVHRILNFKQINWLKEYVKFNKQKKKESTYRFNQNFFKLLVNCIYGKTMENIRKRVSVKLLNNSKDYLRCVSKPNFISRKIFDKNFIAVHQIKSVLTLNKPIYVVTNSIMIMCLINMVQNYCLQILTV